MGNSVHPLFIEDMTILNLRADVNKREGMVYYFAT
jgi:hypothetical protein